MHLGKLLVLILPLVLLSLRCRQSPPSHPHEAWDERNHPENLNTYGQTEIFDKLPLSGQIEGEPWSDTYWPSYQGGIAQRWYGNSSLNQFEYTPHSHEEASHLSLAELAGLSPAEKYDLYTGSPRDGLLDHERRRVGPSDAPWEGLCHGWAAASLTFSEPKPLLAKGPNGLVIPFGAADLKALLSLAQGNYGTTPVQFLGSRCKSDLQRDPEASMSPPCRDTNAGSFHLVLANRIGLRKKGFVMDVTRDREVWNHPVFAYRSRIESTRFPSPGAAPGTDLEIVVTTEVDYTIETLPSWTSLVGTAGNDSRTGEYRYVLEIDGEGSIIGGEWLQEDRPDFLWHQEATELTNRFKPLDDLLRASAQGKEPVFKSSL